MNRIPITKTGHLRLQEEIRQLKTVERPAVISAIAEAREHGDLKENAEYHAAKEQQGFIEGRIRELEHLLASADVIDISVLTGENVKFGATVKLVDEETEEEVIYQIVSEYEARLEDGRIALTAPIARALIGKVEGDSVEVSTPRGMRYYEILTVAFE